MTKELDDLIKVADGRIQGETKKTNKYDTEVRRFINDLNIKESDNMVPKTLVFDYYAQWAKNSPLTANTFYRNFNKYFKTKETYGVRCYLVNPICFGLPEFYSVYKDNRFNYYRPDNIRNTDLKGVYPIAGYYIARLRTEEGLHYLGRFKSAKEAAIKHDVEAFKHFGNDADLNYPRNIREYEKEIKEKGTQVR